MTDMVRPACSEKKRYFKAATTSSRLEMVERKGSAVVKEESWASWLTEAQQSPTIIVS